MFFTFTFVKFFVGTLVTGTAIAVPVLIARGSAGGVAETQTFLSNQTTSQDNSHVSGSNSLVEKEVTSKEQIKQDQLFEDCQKENLKFKVKDANNGGTRWIKDKEYSFSVYGVPLEVDYPPNTCSREVKK